MAHEARLDVARGPMARIRSTALALAADPNEMARSTRSPTESRADADGAVGAVKRRAETTVTETHYGWAIDTRWMGLAHTHYPPAMVPVHMGGYRASLFRTRRQARAMVADLERRYPPLSRRPVTKSRVVKVEVTLKWGAKG